MRMHRATLLILLFAAFAHIAPGQSIYGSLVGAVSDDSGAALPRANVAVTQTETNVTRSVLTNETGGYNLPNLLPGTYQLTVTLIGFHLDVSDRKSTRLNSSHVAISYAVFCLKKKKH